MIIAFANRDSSRVRRFYVELMSYAAISALVTVAAGYLASSDAMVMVSVMVMASVANFLILVRAKAWYCALAAAMILVYVIGLTLTGGGWPMRLVRAYYEITPMDSASWMVVAEYGALAALALAAAQWVRSKTM
jgi:hypothetical protein